MIKKFRYELRCYEFSKEGKPKNICLQETNNLKDIEMSLNKSNMYIVDNIEKKVTYQSKTRKRVAM